HLVDHATWTDHLERTLQLFSARLEQIGRAVPMMAAALSTYVAGIQQIVILGAQRQEDLERAIGSRYRPFTIAFVLDQNQQQAVAAIAPWIGAMKPVDHTATAFVCRNFACERPVTTAAALLEALEETGFGAQGSGQA